MTASKILLLVLDGISDRPCRELGGLTPLQAAEIPCLDRIAAEGVCGIMDTIAPGIRPGSDTSHLSLLGYDPRQCYTGRGPLEALGCGIRMEPGMIGFRGNFATIGEDGRVRDRRAGRIQNTAELTAAIQRGVDLSRLGVTFHFCPGAGHRAALALSGSGLGPNVTSNDPKKEGLPPLEFRPTTDRPEDMKTAEACTEFVRQAARILESHPVNRQRRARGEPPANLLLLRGAGVMGHFEPFEARYGISGSVIAAATLVVGIGRAVGLEHIPVEGATGSTKTNLNGKIAAAVRELERRRFVLLNIKGADEASHDGKALEKKGFIERIDRSLIPLLDLEETLLIVCGDHSTPCSIREHSADPVPVVIHGEGVRTDRVDRFDEVTCAYGGLGRIRGLSLMPIALDLINMAQKYGA